MTRPPDSPERAAHREAITEGLRPPPEPLKAMALPDPGSPIPDIVSPLTASDKLERLVDKSLDRLDNILELDMNMYGDPEQQMAVVRAHLSAVEKILNSQIRVDQNRLRKQGSDTLLDVLKELKEQERKLSMSSVLDLAAE